VEVGVTNDGFPVRTAVAVAAPLLAFIAFATYALWERTDLDAGRLGSISLPCTGAALIASGWAILVAPSRRLQLLGVAALAVTIVTAVLWYVAFSEIMQTT